MEIVKGVVGAISIKEARTGEHGTFAGCGIKVGETWYNTVVSADKQSGALILKDKDYQVIEVGTEIEFLLIDTKGKDGKTYQNPDKKTMKVLSNGNAANPNQQQQGYVPPQKEYSQSAPMQSPPAPTTELPQYDAILNAICYGNAIQMAILKHKDKQVPVDIDEKIDRIASIYVKKAKDGN